ncbi:MAG TPA: hypothetical protein VGI35_03355 [Steroidobacteraceae bacterium]|jgi:hypothetical protein
MKRLLDSIKGCRPLGVAAIASMCFAADAHADGAHQKMMLGAYTDAAEGQTVLAGRYGAVIEVLGGHGLRFKQDELAASTNLCVAYIMTHRWNEARPACDEAIRFAKLEMPESPGFADDAHHESVAMAYSNRAVLEWLEARSASAADDLAKAHTLAPSADFVAQNLARLHASLTAAGSGSPARGSASTTAMAAHG